MEMTEKYSQSIKQTKMGTLYTWGGGVWSCEVEPTTIKLRIFC